MTDPEPTDRLQMVAGDDIMVCEGDVCYVTPPDAGARGLRR